jgi:hypothetical protein
VLLPVPSQISDRPQFIDIAGLVTQKIGAYLNNPLERVKDKADVVELIKRAQLPRDLSVQAEVRAEYLQVWDGLSR